VEYDKTLAHISSLENFIDEEEKWRKGTSRKSSAAVACLRRLSKVSHYNPH
jgi:hypothetical protein